MKKQTRNTRGPGAWVLGGVASLLMCVSAFGQYVATQSTQITIPDSGTGNPYPSTIDLTRSNILGTIEKVSVTVNNLTHPSAPDIGIMLVGPNGKAITLMSGSGGSSSGNAELDNFTLVFSDDASAGLPATQPLVSGSSYKPTDNAGLTFTLPAPAQNITTLSGFAGANPNGVWSLYVMDTTPGPTTTLKPALGSWSLNLQTTPTIAVVTDSSTSVSNIFDGNVLTTFVQENGSVTVKLLVASSSTPVGSLTVGATKLPTLVTNFSTGGSGANPTLTITPNAFAFGTNTLTITGSDGIGSTTTNITLAVLHANQQPNIALSTNSVTTIAGFLTTNVVVASLTDPDTNFDSQAVAKLNLSVTSSDSTIVAPSGVFFTNLTAGGEKRGITVIPAGTGTGTATLTVTVSDGTLTSSQTLTVNVLPVAHPIFANATTISAAASGNANSTIVIPANTVSGLIGNVNVLLNGLQSFEADKSTITLTPPGGSAITLLAATGNSTAQNYAQVQFADGANGSLPAADNLTNTLKLAPTPDQLAKLVGLNANGTWTLTLQNASGVTEKILDGWTLNIFAAPTIGTIPDVFGSEETLLTTTFTIGDIDGTVTNITATFTNSPDPGNARFTSTNSGNTVTLSIQGTLSDNTANHYGTNFVQVVAKDNNGFTATNFFKLGQAFVDHAPTIDLVSRQVVPAGGVLQGIPITVHDIDLPAQTVTVRVSSDTQKLIPDSNLILTPVGAPGAGTYQLTIFPIGTASGSANITITANDGTLTTQSTFNVFVQAPGPLFAQANAITINATAVASPYGSTNTIPAGTLLGQVETVRVTLFGITDPTPANVQVLLVGPTGTNVLLMNGVGGNNALNGATLMFDDTSANTLTSGQIVSGVYVPTQAGAVTALPAPAPQLNYGTTLSVFTNTNPNGNWVLYVNDTASAKGGVIASGWQLSITTAPSIPNIKDQFTPENQSTNITITVGDNQPGANLIVTATPNDPTLIKPITVSGSGSTRTLTVTPQPFKADTNTITVSVTDAAGHTVQSTFKIGVVFSPQAPLFTSFPADQSIPAATQLGPIDLKAWSPQGSPLTVTASSTDNPGLVPSVQVTQTGSTSGTNDYGLSLIPAGALTGTATIAVVASDTNGLKTTQTFTLTVTRAPVFANGASIAIPEGPTTPGQLQQGEATPYPSAINVSGVGGVVSSVQVTLVGLTHQHPEDLDVLLVSPNGKAIMLMGQAGSGGPANGLRINFSDTASGKIPASSQLTSQSYQAGDYSTGLVLPAPAPSRPYGSSLNTTFAGINPNGNWQLYVLDSIFPTGGSIDGGWILFLQTAPGIASIPDQTTPENTALAVPLTLSDAITDPTNLTVAVTTTGDRPATLVVDNFKVTGSGANQTLTITPTTNQPSAYNALNNLTNTPGTNLITVTVTDPINSLQNSASFGFKVTYVNQAPTVTTITNSVFVDENSNLTIDYTVGDVDSVVTNIVATSSDQGLLANSNIVVTIPGKKIDPGTTATVGVKVTPTLNTFGSVTLTLVATDGALFTTNQLTLNINHIWQTPTISSIPDETVIAGSSTTNISFKVGSVEVSTKNLIVTATSDNTALVPNTPANIVLGGTGDTRTIQLFTIGTVAATAHITVTVNDGSTNVNAKATTTFAVTSTAVNNQFANNAAITTSGANKANLYPSTIPVSGLVGATFKVNVVLPNFNHNSPTNLDMLLVEEDSDGKTNAVVLMSGAGGTGAVSNLRLNFDDSGARIPVDQMTNATYAPTDYTTGLILPPNAPTNRIWSATLTSAFAGHNPNGNWKLYVNDRGAGDSGSLPAGWQLIIQTAPTIASTTGSPMVINENDSTNVALTIGDSAIDVKNLTVVASSDNQALVPNRNITIGPITSSIHTGTLTAQVTPAQLQSGTANITFTVQRSDGANASTTVQLQVKQINVPPTISRLDPVSMPENTTSNIQFVVNDVDTPLSALVVKATSGTGDQTLIPSTSLFLAGTKTNQLFGLPSNLLTVTLAPQQFQVGSATITITVTDQQPSGNNVVVSSFPLTVTTLVFPPFFISSPGPQSVAAGGQLANIPFKIASQTAAANTLTAVGTSDNQSVVKDANIIIASSDASGTNRTITLTAEKSQTGGTANITITVTDPANNATAKATFAVTVGKSRVLNFANNHLINIIDNSTADVYPSQITVSGVVGPISQITASLNGFTHTFPSDVGVLLVGPAGQKIVLQNNLGGGHPGAVSVTNTFDQTAAGAIPVNGPDTTGSYLPLDNSGGTRVFQGSAPGTPYTNTLNAFNGTNPNGTWSLYVEDFTPPDSGAISNGWSLAITTLPIMAGLTDTNTPENTTAVENFTVGDDTPNKPTFTFSATSDNQNVVTNGGGVTFSGSGTNWTVTINPVPNAFGSANITVTMVNVDGQSITSKFKVTFNQVFYPPVISAIPDATIPAGGSASATLTYSDIGVPQNQLIVTFASDNTNLVPVGNMKQVGNQLLITPVGVQQGTANITVTVSNQNTPPQSTNTTFKLTVIPSSTPVFAQTSAVTIKDNAAAAPYPSTLSVAGLSGTISDIKVTLLGVGHQFPSDISVLLVGPAGQKVVLMSRAGGTVSITNTRLTFDDAAANSLPQASLIADGSYKPTDYKTSDTFPGPAPIAPYAHALSAFDGTNPNGTWSLYVQDDQAGGSGVIAGGWLLDITTTGPSILLSGTPPITTPENTAVTVPFTVSETGFNPSNLVVTVTNTADSPSNLVASLSLSGAGSSRSVLITPTAGLPSSVTTNNGSSTITLTVTDGTLTNSLSFALVVTFSNLPPVITGLVNTNTPANVPAVESFTVSDVDTASSNVVVAVTTGTPGLGTATVSGSNGVEVLTYKPTGVVGTNTVTVTATDGQHTVTNSVTVVSDNGLPPVIGALANQTLASSRGGLSVKVPIAVNTGPLGASNVTVTATADNTNLVPLITVTGSGTNFTATVSVAPLLLGTAQITVVAKDVFGSATNGFTLTLRQPVGPILAPIADVVTPDNVSTNVTLSITSPDTGLGSLLFSATDTNSALLKSVTFAIKGTNEVATLNVVSNMVGFDVVTIHIGDGFTNVSQSFKLTVTPLGPITISPIGVQNTVVGTPAKVSLTITSPSTSVTNLTLSGTSTNKALVSNVTFTYNGRNEVAVVNLIPNTKGDDFVTVTATDGFSSASQGFILHVTGTVTNTTSTIGPITISAGQVGFTVTGPPNAVYTVQSTTDFKTWTTVTTITANASGVATFSAPVGGNKVLFYRLKQ